MRKLAFAAAAALIATAAFAQTADDPYLWLEDINGARAVAQVQQWNRATEDLLTHSAAYEQYRARALAILDDERHIAEPEAILGDQVTNHWVDAKNPRGLWRVASLSSYVAGKPQWRTLIDVDALGKARGQELGVARRQLPGAGLSPLPRLAEPGRNRRRCRPRVRHADRPVRADGFALADAKSNSTWVDRDTLLVATDYGEGSLTTSGYPRVVKLWTRGTPLARGQDGVHRRDRGRVCLALRRDGGRQALGLHHARQDHLDQRGVAVHPRRALVKMPLPDTADFNDVIEGRLIATLNAPLGDLPAGAIVSYSLADIAAGRTAAPNW